MAERSDTAPWHPITTAPTSTEVLVWCPIGENDGWCYTAFLDGDEWFASCGGTPCFPDDGSCGEYRLVRERLFPTLWMPKPTPYQGQRHD